MSIFGSLRQLLRPQSAARQPAIPAGERVYAIGDIHGRADLFAALITAIEGDDAARNANTPAKTTIILLGDLIDRGPDSAGVVRMARQWQQHRPIRILCGNHEEMLLEAMNSTEVLRGFLRLGGRETVLSYGMSEEAYKAASYEEVQAMLLQAIPADLENFIRCFEDQIRMGDYVFVHAGVKPGVPLDQQQRNDLRWIREPFLGSTEDHGAMVVHGHTIHPEIVERPNRIGIDTGAYDTGKLTAIGLEGTERWFLQTNTDSGTIHTSVLNPA